MLRHKRENDAAQNDGQSQHSSNEEFSEEDINEAIRQSLAEHVAERNAKVEEKREVDKAMAASIAGLLKVTMIEPQVPVVTPKDQTEPIQSPAKCSLILLYDYQFK